MHVVVIRLDSSSSSINWLIITSFTYQLSLASPGFVSTTSLPSNPAFVGSRYRNALQWVDNSIAFYTRHLAEKVRSPACGAFPAGNVTLAELGECDKAATAYYLCEVSATSKKEQHGENENPQPSIQLPLPQHQTFDSISHPVICPEGHTTHDFLACDVASSCWADNYVISSDGLGVSDVSCAVSLSSLPPSFLCSNGRERVPYTLVCDHRQDCSDRSDEDFCRFPPCCAGSQLQCSNQQVSCLQCTNQQVSCL